jgi:hypothetical protein
MKILRELKPKWALRADDSARRQRLPRVARDAATSLTPALFPVVKETVGYLNLPIRVMRSTVRTL